MSAKLVQQAIRVNNKFHNRFYNPYLFWEADTMLLKTVSKKVCLIPWCFDQVFGVFLYGFMACGYCVIREVFFHQQNTKANLLHVTLFAAASITAYTLMVTTHAMVDNSREIIAGIGAFQAYQSKLSYRYPLLSFEVAMEKGHTQKLLGLWLLSSIIMSASTVLFVFPAIYFNLDPTYFIFRDIATIYFQENDESAARYCLILLLIRFLLTFVYLFCVSRFYSFLYIFGLIQIQGYLMALSFLAKLHLATNLFSELRKMRILHSCFSPFCNVLYAMIALYGQLTILLLWTVVRGWSRLPPEVVLFLPLFAFIIGGWTFFIMTIVGSAHYMSVEVVQRGRHNLPPRFRGKLLGYQLIKRERLAQFPMSFKCGSLFIISKESGLVFLFKLLENIANSIIIFKV